jgi:hypothetical protein
LAVFVAGKPQRDSTSSRLMSRVYSVTLVPMIARTTARRPPAPRLYVRVRDCGARNPEPWGLGRTIAPERTPLAREKNAGACPLRATSPASLDRWMRSWAAVAAALHGRQPRALSLVRTRLRLQAVRPLPPSPWLQPWGVVTNRRPCVHHALPTPRCRSGSKKWPGLVLSSEGRLSRSPNSVHGTPHLLPRPRSRRCGTLHRNPAHSTLRRPVCLPRIPSSCGEPAHRRNDPTRETASRVNQPATGTEPVTEAAPAQTGVRRRSCGTRWEDSTGIVRDASPPCRRGRRHHAARTARGWVYCPTGYGAPICGSRQAYFRVGPRRVGAPHP